MKDIFLVLYQGKLLSAFVDIHQVDNLELKKINDPLLTIVSVIIIFLTESLNHNLPFFDHGQWISNFGCNFWRWR